MDIHKKIKKLRLDRKITQEDLAKELQVSRKTVSSWETGRNTPDIQTIQKICSFYDVGIHDVFENSEKTLKKDEKFNILKFSYYLNIFLLTLSSINSFEPFGIRLSFITPLLIINLIVYKVNYPNWKVKTKEIIHNKETYIFGIIFLFLSTTIDLASLANVYDEKYLDSYIIALLIHQFSMLFSFIVAIYFKD